ncbi:MULTISPECIES: hypothetical protein [Corallococcus]|uniref:hypothetical protein n=1 Tax=Corallococcus TaxID=83461 RepID=UPI001180F22E|nr:MULTISPECIES: hypothetical protein [Corallococcus]NBD14309.1 hypothetical protein [Corallococcus silvisoli]TSC29392.1 hypothetical protein FOF48_15860 [Corallococcus sp. Z5C101001]
MFKSVFRTIALAAVVFPGFAVAQSYVDPNPYVVQPGKYPFAVYPAGYVMNDRVAWESQVAPFNPNTTYTVGQEYAILQDETNRTGGVLQLDPTDYTHNITIQQATIPEAFQHLVPPPTEIMPWTNPVQTFNKTYVRTEKFGNSIFGAGYSINAVVTAETATQTAEKKVQSVAEGKIFGTAFSTEKELVRGRANVSGQAGGANSGTAALYLLGQEIWSSSLYAEYSPPPINWSRTFFSVSKTFVVGPVPITVKAALAGGVKLTVYGQIGPTVAKLSATPGGWSNVTASASVDVIIVAFGVEGSVALINATMPSSGELFWPVCTLDWKLKSDLNLNTLSGTLKAFAKIRILFFSKTWWVTIASWPGITRNWALLNLTESQPLGICS